ncbi:MAG: M1 family metallopeptidase, partial [Bacteroidetes bacterium]|nr:M1 family metallopeptidase [Fibrella sp.]
PVGPGETIVLDINFRAKLPKIFARTGFSRDYFLVGQWFPKIGVYEPAGMRYAKVGQWNCHQFHADSEFYADYGVYDVNITLPQNYQTGATGLMISEKANENGTKTQRWHAEDVVDFAWTASPRFEVVTDQWKNQSGNPVNIRLLVQPEHRHQAQRHLDAAKRALTYFGKHLGAYRFPNLTIVDPPFHGSGSAGMEYPTFITAGTVSFLTDGMRFPEAVTIHEFGHQYFMQLLASNEFEEAWLDEGFNQYYEGRIMDETYGPRASQVDWFGYRTGDAESARDGYVHTSNPGASPAFGNTWQLPEGQYGALTYFKTATWLRTLDGLVGRPVMDEIMQTYFIRWRWKHPCATDFIAIVNEIVPKRLGTRYGPDMNWFFGQVLYGDQVCDYALTSVTNKKEGNRYQSTVRVDRLGSMKLPVEVLVHFENGKEKLVLWDGQSGRKTIKLTQTTPVLWAKADPSQKLYVDTNLNNNSFTLEPDRAPAGKYAVKLMFWVQNWMQWLAWLA